MKWICKNCGSADIEIRLWYKPNTNQTVIKDFTSVEDEEVWCHACDGGGYGLKVIEQPDNGVMLGDIPDEVLFKTEENEKV